MSRPQTSEMLKSQLTVAPRTVQSETVDKLRNAILMGQFKPGARLAEAMLCDAMNVSRTSIREALRRLEGEKLIVIVPNKGPSVAKIRWEDVKAIYETRALLEGEIAYRAATEATPEDIREMRRALRAFNSAIVKDDAAARVATTSEFYDVMLKRCGNHIIGEILQSLNARINFLRFQSMSQPGRSKHSAVELKTILDALESGNATAAREAAVEHVKLACAAVRALYEAG